MIQYFGLIWLGLLTLEFWAALSVWSSSARMRSKAGWTLALLLLPLLGLIGWFLIGPRRTA